jgi:hypothetical protein
MVPANQKALVTFIKASQTRPILFHAKEANRGILGCGLEAVRPELIVCLGATAAQSLIGWTSRLFSPTARSTKLTTFFRSLPACIRLPFCAPGRRERDNKILLDDLRCIADFLKK